MTALESIQIFATSMTLQIIYDTVIIAMILRSAIGFTFQLRRLVLCVVNVLPKVTQLGTRGQSMAPYTRLYRTSWPYYSALYVVGDKTQLCKRVRVQCRHE